jgi:hypothetical protein
MRTVGPAFLNQMRIVDPRYQNLMRIVVPAACIVVGVVWLWIAYKGKTTYYGGPGARSDVPVPPRLGRAVHGLLGVFALFLAVWILLHQR